MKADSASDKREYFRVNQELIFDVKPVDAFAADNDVAENEFDDAVSLNLLNELRRLDRDNVQTLRLLTEKNRLLGDYLQTLSSKIDLIARHALFAQHIQNPNAPTRRVNLSEDGLAFLSERVFYKGAHIAVRMIFLPSYIPVSSYAEILRCESKGDGYQVAARFQRMAEVERQELSRQILKAQVAHRKALEKNRPAPS